MLPLVTVVTPAYNRARYLDETMESVLSQDYPSIEYIVLDDGSTDETPHILARYEGRIVRASHPNMGETQTVNKGWGMARGDFIMTVNSDDPLFPGAISEAVAFMKDHPDVLVGYPDWDMIGPQSELVEHRQVPEYDYMLMLKLHYCFVGPGAIMRRQVFQLAGMRDPEFRYVADFDFWLRLGLHVSFARIPKTLATFRVHPDSTSVFHQGASMAEEHLRLAEKLYSQPDMPIEVLRAKSKAFAWANYVAGRYFVKDAKLTRELFARALRHCPQSFFSLETFSDLRFILSVVTPRVAFKVLKFCWRMVRPIVLPVGRVVRKHL
jgi:glycosyltransferase involved in cell wall biosynthesis